MKLLWCFLVVSVVCQAMMNEERYENEKIQHVQVMHAIQLVIGKRKKDFNISSECMASLKTLIDQRARMLASATTPVVERLLGEPEWSSQSAKLRDMYVTESRKLIKLSKECEHWIAPETVVYLEKLLQQRACTLTKLSNKKK